MPPGTVHTRLEAMHSVRAIVIVKPKFQITNYIRQRPPLYFFVSHGREGSTTVHRLKLTANVRAI
jgi:hypothetical protein